MFDEELKLTEQAKTSLVKAMRWLQFFAVLGVLVIILLILMAIFFVVAPTVLQTEALGNASFAVAALYVIIALLYLYPVKKAFNVVSNTRKAINENDSMSLELAAKAFHAMLKFCGILTIIVIVAYVLIAIGIAIAGFNI